jgi:hypothetical protein
MQSIQEAPTGRRFHALIPITLVCVAAWFLFARGMQRDLNHDEHQFLAPAALLAREGLLPYRDYPLFHLPNLVFAYGALDWLSGRLVFSAKTLCIAASVGIIAILMIVVWRERGIPISVRTALAAGVVVGFMYDPVILYTAGKTWNHEIPTFLLLGAIVLQAFTFHRPSLIAAAVAGLLGALSVGTRLTFGPSLVPLFILAFLVAGPPRVRFQHGVMWSAGAFLGFLPSLWMFALSPEAFLFGNFEFPRLRVSDETNLRVQKTIRLDKKLRFVVKEVIRPSWPLFLLLFTIAVPSAWGWLRKRQGSAVAAFAVFVLPFALLGCLAPTRYQYQHFFGFMGVVVLAVAGAAAYRLRTVPRGMAFGVIAVVALTSVLGAAFNSKIRALYAIRQPPFSKWFAWKVSQESAVLKTHLSTGVVFTLAPVTALEAGLKIVPELATAPFGLRSAHYVPLDRRLRLKLPAPEDLNSYFQEREPDAVLTGVEDELLEAPLLKYAKQHGYKEIRLSRKKSLWLRSGDKQSQPIRSDL